MRHPFRRRLLKPRMLLPYAAVLALFWLAAPTPAGFAAGAALVAVGEGLRAWGAGHLVKNERLTVSGPYAHLRHPLYAGTLLLSVGFACMAGGWATALLLPLALAVFFFYYFPYKERIESARLERFYGAPYAAYRAAVPALLFAPAAWVPPPEVAAQVSVAGRWSFGRFRANDEDGALLAILGGVLLLALRPLLPL